MSQFPPPIPPASSPIPPSGGGPPVIPPTIAGPLYAGVRPHRGGLILGLGIGSLGVWFLSMVGALIFPCCGTSGLVSLGLAIPAWIMANADLAAMNTGAMDPIGRGSTQGGKICAIISVVIHAISFLVIMVLLLLGIVFAGAMAASGARGGH
jgi:hypothetical protein